MPDETPNPSPEEKTLSTPSSGPRFSLSLMLMAILLVAAAVYAFHERSLSHRLVAENGQIATSLDATRGQVDALNAKLNELSAQQAARLPPAPAASPARPHRVATRARRDDPRWKQLQAQLEEQQKQIDSTRQDLGNAHTELTGSIARTHDELVVLQKKGERSYFEFDIDKSGQFQKDGPVGIRLRKANTKHQYVDLEMMVDDFKVSRKHVNVFEPVIFYAAGNGQPVELVINKIDKNHVHGYVSEPKYKSSELQAMSNSGTNPANNASDGQSAAPAPPAPKPRTQLQVPKSN
ncbi:MAG TPA: hypothetical protein VJX16_26965 [Terriglobales bacterium]|nr:hypothetical protein [Terriglobales bacterium]